MQELNYILEQRYQENLEAFRSLYPNIAKIFKDYVPNRAFDFVLLKNGALNIEFNDSNAPFYKTDDTVGFARKQVLDFIEETVIQNDSYEKLEDSEGQISFKYMNHLIDMADEKIKNRKIKLSEVKSLSCLIMISCGLGYHLAELYERIEIESLIVIEPDKDLFFASLYCFDWKNLLHYIREENLGLHLIIGDNKEILTEIDSFFYKRGLFLMSNRGMYIHYANTQTFEVMSQLMNFNSLLLKQGYIDDYLFGISHCCWAIKNKIEFVINTITDEIIKNYPVFIIGSGPSLDNDISFIRKNQDKAIIVACGTALDALYHAGIKPDFYANTERLSNVFSSLKIIPDEKFFDGIFLLASSVCHPNVMSYFREHLLFEKGNEPFLSYLYEGTKDYNVAKKIYFMNPLVGNMGVAGTVFLGFKELYLFGLDNGQKTGGKAIHSALSRLYSEAGCSDQSDRFIGKELTKGNFGGDCLTNKLYKRSMFNISNLLRQFNSVKCYNCSDGSYIAQTIPIHSSDLETTFDRNTPIDKDEFREYLKTNITGTLNISDDTLHHFLDENLFNSMCCKLKKKLAVKGNSRFEQIKIFSGVSQMLTAETGILGFQSTLLYSTLQSFFVEILNVLYGEKDENKCLEYAHEMTEVIIDFLDEAAYLFGFMPDYINGEHRKYFKNGKVGADMPHCKAPVLPAETPLYNPEYHSKQKSFEKKY